VNYGSGVRAFGGGLGDLAASMLGSEGIRQKAQRDQEQRLAQAYAHSMSGRKSAAEAGLLEDQLAALPGLGSAYTTQGESLGLGMTPEQGGAMATIARAGGGKQNWGDLAAGYWDRLRQGQALGSFDAGNRERANFELAMTGRTPVTPFEQSAQGSVLNTATGAVDQSNPLAGATLGNIAAQEAERLTSAGRHEATAERLTTLTPHEQARLEAQAGYYNARAAKPGAGGGGSYKAADANAIYGKAAELYGGYYDPVTGQLRGLQENAAASVTQLGRIAEELYLEAALEGTPIGHLEAVSLAAERMGIELPRPPGTAPGAPLGPAGADPLGLRGPRP